MMMIRPAIAKLDAIIRGNSEGPGYPSSSCGNSAVYNQITKAKIMIKAPTRILI